MKTKLKKECHSTIGGSPARNATHSVAGLAELPGRHEPLAELGQAASGGKYSAFCISAFAARQSAAAARRRLHSAFLSAFTLLEVIIAAALFGLVMAGTIGVYVMCSKVWHATSLSMQTTRESSLALSRMIYGMGTNSGLRSASMITNINISGGSWHMTVSNLFGEVQHIYYNSPQQILSNANSIICKNVSSATATVNSAGGTVGIQLTVREKDGMFVSSNQVSTFVKMRNKF